MVPRARLARISPFGMSQYSEECNLQTGTKHTWVLVQFEAKSETKSTTRSTWAWNPANRGREVYHAMALQSTAAVHTIVASSLSELHWVTAFHWCFASECTWPLQSWNREFSRRKALPVGGWQRWLVDFERTWINLLECDILCLLVLVFWCYWCSFVTFVKGCGMGKRVKRVDCLLGFYLHIWWVIIFITQHYRYK